jgi:hypothetical protein
MATEKDYIDGRTCSTGLLVSNLVGVTEDEEATEMTDNIRAIMYCSARRLFMLAKIAHSLTIGLIVTNAAWVAHALGWF